MATTIMRNYANNAQARIPQIRKPRSVFPVRYSRKQTQKASDLVPIFAQEVLPGDTWQIRLDSFIRLMPQVTSPIDNLIISTYFFFVPNRLTWDNFPKQHGEKKNPDDTIDYITPAMTVPQGGFAHKSLQDYLCKAVGVNCKNTSTFERAYNKIYNDYFRAEMLQDSIEENTTDQDDDPTKYTIRKITKAHDYFTDCLPTLQQGDPVQIPLGTSAPVYTAGNNNANNTNNAIHWKVFNANGTVEDNNSYNLAAGAHTNGYREGGVSTTNSGLTAYATPLNLYADLSEAAAADIAALRLMIRTQEILEADNRGGVRYTELLQNRYGTINPDLQLYRAQYLGGTRTPFFTTPVVQTSGTGTTGQNTPQGNIAGYGTGGDSGNVIKQSFGEFGVIIGLMAITAIPQYQYGMQKKFTRFERFDYMYPEFQGISDQAVYNKEIFAQDDTILGADGVTPVNDEVFGYIPRYDEYRYFTNEICGELRSTYPQSLDVWTYAENMSNLPALNSDFIEDKTDEILQRTMAVQTGEGGEIEDQFLVDIAFTGSVARVLTSKPIPTTGGRLL